MKKQNTIHISVRHDDGSEMQTYAFNNFKELFRFTDEARFFVNEETSIIHYSVGYNDHNDLHVLAKDKPFGNIRINIYDKDGRYISAAFFLSKVKEAIERYERSRPLLWRPNYSYKFRDGPVPGTGKIGTYEYFRSIKTHQERRNAVACEKDPMGRSLVRGGRSGANVPTSWEDIGRNITRSWKKHRKTQWKS